MLNFCQISWHISCTHQKTYDIPEDGQEMSPKHVGGINNKNIVQHVGIKYYVCKIYVVPCVGRKLQSGELHSLCFLHNVMIINSRRRECTEGMSHIMKREVYIIL